MSAAKEQANRVRVKRELAAKYFSLANTTKSTPRRKAYLYRAEKYTRQAAMMSRKFQVE